MDFLNKLPTEIVSLIIEKIVKDRPREWKNIRLCCSLLNKAALHGNVVRYLDVWPRLCGHVRDLDPVGKRVLSMLEEAGNSDAQIMMGVHLFFNDGSTEQGLEKLHAAATKSQAVHANYIYSIALLSAGRMDGLEVWNRLIQLENFSSEYDAARAALIMMTINATIAG